MTINACKAALKSYITKWYENAHIDYGISGRFLDAQTYGEKGQHLSIFWEEDGKRYKMPISWWTEYSAEQVYNIWMECAGDEDTEKLPQEPVEEKPSPKFNVKQANTYLTVTVAENNKYASFVLPVSGSANLVAVLGSIKGLSAANICATKKDAIQISEFWNECFRKNGTYLYDTVTPEIA